MFIPIFQRFKEKSRIVLNVQSLSTKELIEFSEVVFALVLEIGDVGLVVDEVGEIVSQQKEKYSPQYERLVRIGRNYGVRPVIQITQRPQKVDKNVLALSDYYMTMGLSHNLDLNAVKDLIGLDTYEFQDIRKEIKKQTVGECLLVKHDGEITRTKFNMDKDILKERNPARRQTAVLKEAVIEEEQKKLNKERQ